MKIRIDPLDVLFSKIVRFRANGRCQRCLKPTDFGSLQAAHCWGRRKKSVRWDLDNALGLCFHCHRQIDSEDPEAKKDLFIKYLGVIGYKQLGQRANWTSLQKPDKKLIEMFLKKELQKYVKSS